MSEKIDLKKLDIKQLEEEYNEMDFLARNLKGLLENKEVMDNLTEEEKEEVYKAIARLVELAEKFKKIPLIYPDTEEKQA